MPPKVLAVSRLTGSVLKEGKETYDAALKLEDAAANHKKFYNMQVVQSKDKSKYWFVQHWGRIGTSGQHQVKGPMGKDAAIKMMVQKFRQKAGVKFEERGKGGAAAPGSTASSGKYEMLDRRLNKAKAGRAKSKGSVAISLMWENTKRKSNDLDLHVTPPSKEKIWFDHKKSRCGGRLDVDRREGCLEPVENVIWKKAAPKGDYTVEVVNYDSANNTSPVKFDVGICINGGETQIISKKVPGKHGSKVLVKKFKYAG